MTKQGEVYKLGAHKLALTNIGGKFLSSSSSYELR